MGALSPSHVTETFKQKTVNGKARNRSFGGKILVYDTLMMSESQNIRTQNPGKKVLQTFWICYFHSDADIIFFKLFAVVSK